MDRMDASLAVALARASRRAIQANTLSHLALAAVHAPDSRWPKSAASCSRCWPSPASTKGIASWATRAGKSATPDKDKGGGVWDT